MNLPLFFEKDLQTRIRLRDVLQDVGVGATIAKLHHELI